MENIIIENVKNSLLSAQKSIYSASVVATVVYVLVAAGKLDNITIPFIDIEASGKSAVLIVMALYISFGAQLWHSLHIANKNLSKISDQDTKEALLLSPTILFGPFYFRILAVLLPYLVLVGAFYSAFDNNLLVAVLIAFVYSVCHFFAISESIKLKA